jgi:hypothetical protein
MRLGVICSLFLCVSLLGCSSDRNSVDKRLAALQEDITRLQADNDRLDERVDALEVKSVPAAAPPAAASSAANSSAMVERPPLKVVKVVPTEEGATVTPESEDGDVHPAERADAPGSRPMIRLRGSKQETRNDEARVSTARPASTEEGR